MSRREKKHHSNEIDYWQPTSDMLISLLLILLLVILLLGLYILHIPEQMKHGYKDGIAEATTEDDRNEEHR